MARTTRTAKNAGSTASSRNSRQHRQHQVTTKDSIISLPSPHLRQGSQKVGLINDQIKQLVTDMITATLDWEDSRQHELGVALAAVQVDQPLKVIIVRNDFDDKNNREFDVFINPEITKYEGTLVEDYEGCLSVPDVYGKVPRYSKVRIKATNLNGHSIRLKAEGFLARVFQHEIDHTKGVVFIDHIKDQPEAFYRLESDGQLQPMNYDREIKLNKKLWV